jgi:YHS domain-containing protein
MKEVLKKMTVAIMVIIGMNIANAQSVNADENKVANDGYDVVNYFTTNTAERGSAKFSTTNEGATYYFINEENRDAFVENPSKYLPQFDGYCSFAVAKLNKKVPVNPETFRIDDGKLYLFYNDFWDGNPFNTIVPWLNNEAEMEKMAAANWEILKSN